MPCETLTPVGVRNANAPPPDGCWEHLKPQIDHNIGFQAPSTSQSAWTKGDPGTRTAWGGVEPEWPQKDVKVAVPVRDGRVVDRAQAVDAYHVVLEPSLSGDVAVVARHGIGEERRVAKLGKVRGSPRAFAGRDHVVVHRRDLRAQKRDVRTAQGTRRQWATPASRACRGA